MAKNTPFTVENHILVPKHSLINQKEKDEIIKEYNISISNLPRILNSDKAIQDLKVKDGDIIKVERQSPTAGKTVFYRLVVNE
ncbi:MAG: DNA-directed RNA polymerase subunit H [Nanoarchaeota archaeon]|nr:DNA-directed RNA polymerase subunit H [Nanoarchaeota archaeon]